MTMHVERSSTSVAQRLNVNAYARPNAMQKAERQTVVHSIRPNMDAAGEAEKLLAEKNAPPAAAGVGLVVMNASLYPLSFNPEAMRILCYPNDTTKVTNGRQLEAFLAERIRSGLIKHEASGEYAFVT